MRKCLLLSLIIAVSAPAFSQNVDSIYMNLYTDSLKKGQHNYINVDGKMSTGRWISLSSKEIQYSCPSATFESNQLVIPENFKEEKVTVKAVLKSNPAVSVEKTIWIKKKPDGPLPTTDEVLNPKKTKNKNKD